ncbi:hypothetical protein [Haliea sp. E17]|uniref:hypothetical protein n=1 Tax=Haliea sp. E17 TaxID=3401576 RepID=UPI003AAD03C9
MYRYCVDNAVTYSPEDIVLFRESPFASWMERLTLENPDHGIAPDADSPAPAKPLDCQEELAQLLLSEHKHVELINPQDGEPQRRTATLGAMRSGVDFIVNGQLAVGPLSGSANLLMRTSGYSEMGNYLYIPCDTQAKTTLSSAFRLCFLADLLHSLQGQLPPQMLVIRSGSDLVPLRTEDHIYHYRAVKQRFMREMAGFRKHRMPDPSESVHFGRWSQCANDVMRKRVLREAEEEQVAEEILAAGEETAEQDLASLVMPMPGPRLWPTGAPPATLKAPPPVENPVPEAFARAPLASPVSAVPRSPTVVDRGERGVAPQSVGRAVPPPVLQTSPEVAPGDMVPGDRPVTREAPSASLGTAAPSERAPNDGEESWDTIRITRPFSSSLITSPPLPGGEQDDDPAG